MTPMELFYERQAASIIKALEKRGMEGYYCPDGKSAVEKAMSFIPDGSTVSWGGSQTLEECGMMDALKASPLTLIDRSLAKTQEEKKEYYRRAFSVDYYFMSTNAITLDGQLVNIDGTGNRVAALSYGPDHVIIMAGMNKAVRDADAAVRRAHDQAAPPNTMRLDMKTPCSLTGACADCLSPHCICAQTLITRFNRSEGRIKVILIGENYGY